MVNYIRKMKFSAFFLLACGAVVRQTEALSGLEGIVKRYEFLSLIFPSLTRYTGWSSQMPLPLVLSI